MIEIKIDAQNLRRAERLLVNMGQTMQRPTSALKEIGVLMMASVDKNFEEQGRPIKWAPLSPMTIAMRRNKNKDTIKILQDTGHLRRSISYQLVGEDGVAIGTNVEYGRIHQFGGDRRIPKRTIIPKKAKALRFTINGKVVYAKKVEQKSRMVHIPQRPFLKFQDEDIVDIRTILLEHIQNENLTE